MIIYDEPRVGPSCSVTLKSFIGGRHDCVLDNDKNYSNLMAWGPSNREIKFTVGEGSN